MKKIKIVIFLIMFSLNNVNAEVIEIKPNEIFKNLRCLICQGQSVADSNSDFAQTMKLVVRDQINDGKSEKEIYEFLIEKYGEWIVYKPPLNKANFILWILPYLVFAIGGVIIFLLLKKRENY
ncbi:cytochrome c-type biogenesis protein CcmH [Pelagibacteraceae bacterium]|jgi:cytochrome c-type biogenesis protein CcmH|nr:cytochrome c-type biogenesis protein CcmH [Pelagibacteraceae bacterium]|tara:strand:+ start:934 stop:1302 length:369 start_codon:yes stop_codon:yes gene_type:complete